MRVYENGKELLLPDSVRSRLAGSELRPVLLKWLASEGYFNAAIDSVSQPRIVLNRGCPFQFDALSYAFAGNPDSLIDKTVKGRFSSSRLLAEIEEISKELEGEGYYFITTKIISFQPDFEKCTVVVELEIDPGKKWFSEGIVFSGAKLNNQDYLRKISGYRDSTLIKSTYLKRLRTNLIQSALFNDVAMPQVFARNGSAVIVIAVKERSLNAFDGLLGYVPDATGEGQIVGNMSLSLWNVLQQGNGIDFEYQRLRPETSRLNLGIRQDWIGNLPVGIGIGFNFYQNDTTYQTRAFHFDTYYIASPRLKINGGVLYQASTAGDNQTNSLEPDGKKLSVSLGFELSTLDNPDVPIRGNIFSLNFGVARKSPEIDSVRTFIQRFTQADAGIFFPLSAKSILAVSAHGYVISADKVTISDLIKFGGANSFRGYSEEQFSASRLGWAEVEYRFLINRESYLFGFGATGAFHRPKLLTETDNSFKYTDSLYSTGFGLSYLTKLGRLTFTYAVSPEETIANGKVHFGISTSL